MAVLEICFKLSIVILVSKMINFLKIVFGIVFVFFVSAISFLSKFECGNDGKQYTIDCSYNYVHR